MHGRRGECTSSIEAQSPAIAVLAGLRRLAQAMARREKDDRGGWRCTGVATRVELPRIGMTQGLFPFLS